MTLALDFQGQIKKSFILGMGGLIDMEQKGYESIGCWTHHVTLSYDLDLGLSRSNFEIAISKEWDCWMTWDEIFVSRIQNRTASVFFFGTAPRLNQTSTVYPILVEFETLHNTRLISFAFSDVLPTIKT